jgi:hypothetical protein
MKHVRRLLSATLVLACAGFSTATLRDEAVTAQQRKPIKITRIFTGPDGQTHAEELEARLGSGGSGSELSETIKVTGLQFRRTSPNYFVDWHTAPQRQYVVTLSGRGEVELQGGRKVPLEPGHILLAEDTTGKGHISRGVGTEDRISLFIQLAQ